MKAPDSFLCLRGWVGPIRSAAFLSATVVLVTLPSPSQGQTDNFNDGNDEGWTRYDPRGTQGLGPQTFFSFPGDNSYRIQTPITPALNGGGANPGRAGALRQDVTYTDFYVSVDIIDWDDTTRQAFGLLARVTNPGLGTLNGYAFTYERGAEVSETSGDTDLSRVTGEDPTGLPTGDTDSAYHLDATKDYRFVFIGRGPRLEGRIYELPDIINPVKVIVSEDSTYTQGWCGLVTFDNSGGNGVTDCTFDNYFAAVVEPPRLFVDYNFDFHEVIVSWGTNSGPLRLQSTEVLVQPISWSDISEALIFPFGNRLQYTESPEENQIKMFRLIQE